MAKIVVYFPGVGYHCDKPLLYYGRKVAISAGYENEIKLTYSYQTSNIRGDEQKMRETLDTLYQQAEEMLSQVDWTKYDEILFVSKSIGTIISTSYANKYQIKNVKHVLYTPVEYTFSTEIHNAIAFIGTKDPWSDVKKVCRMAKEQNIPIYLYEGCNHSLEEENPFKNLEILKDVMEKTKQFI